jgi:hypothetical protein
VPWVSCLSNSEGASIDIRTEVSGTVEFGDTGSLFESVKETSSYYIVDLSQEVKKHQFRTSHWFQRGLLGGAFVIAALKIRSIGAKKIIRDIQWQIEQTGEVLTRFFYGHLEEPLMNIYRTIRYDEAAIGIQASASNLESQRNALAIMVMDYMKHHRPEEIASPERARQIVELARNNDLSPVMSDYAAMVASPVKSAVFGSLIQLLLIQVHKLKVDAEKSVIMMDQLMRANELNFQLLALVPAILGVGGLSWWFYRLTHPRLNPKVLGSIRKHLREIAIVVNSYNVPEAPAVSWQDAGRLVFRVNCIQELAAELPEEERDCIIADTQEVLDTSFTIHQKLSTINRIYHNLSM